jgi:periplasmic protein TonB
MGVRWRTAAACAFAGAVIAACAPQPQVATSQRPGAYPMLEAYKKLVARRIVQRARDVYSEPMPEVMKAVVVLDITIDRAGNLVEASVYRSNGHRELESRALESVARAAPFAAPAPGLLEGAMQLTYLETFLFRDDDCFQIRSLVDEGWTSFTASPPAWTGI